MFHIIIDFPGFMFYKHIHSTSEFTIACRYLHKIKMPLMICSFPPVTNPEKWRKMKKEKKDKEIEQHENYIRKIFARNLKKLRGERHISQMELASIANISPNFINEIENERKSPSIETFAKLVKALSVEPARLFEPEIMLEANNAEMLKTELNSIITTAVNESVDRHINDNPRIK